MDNKLASHQIDDQTSRIAWIQPVRKYCFIPCSTNINWINKYPHASPALECNENGKVAVYLNYRPYPNGLGELGSSDGRSGDGISSGTTGLGEGGATAVNMLKDNTYMLLYTTT